MRLSRCLQDDDITWTYLSLLLQDYITLRIMVEARIFKVQVDVPSMLIRICGLYDVCHSPCFVSLGLLTRTLCRCSAIVLKSGKEGQFEKEGYGQVSWHIVQHLNPPPSSLATLTPSVAGLACYAMILPGHRVGCCVLSKAK